MQRLSICSRCWISLFHSSLPGLSGVQYTSRRFRSGSEGKGYQKRRAPVGLEAAKGGYKPSRYSHRSPLKVPNTDNAEIPLEAVPDFFRDNVLPWTQKAQVRKRLTAFGIPAQDIRPLLRAFCEDVQSGNLSTPESYELYDLDRFSESFSQSRSSHIDQVYTNIFYTWASNPSQQKALEKLTSPTTISDIHRLTAAVNMKHPSDNFPAARAMRRKVIMHVGPTNSGKTHNALRALAAAHTGAYAGPLRLLAHEIWERLNKGQIVPAGVDPDAHPDPDPETALDIAPIDGKPIVRKGEHPNYARACNMLTGEEQKIVDDNAPLLSATVEMISRNQYFDVAVIDEIQMIGDPERGNSWTDAVLGLCAKEVHLCGEETAVPLIQELLKETGDELTVNRYQRLTPLVVEDQSLGGDLKNVRKGDCVVAFSRSGIFGLKKRVEELTGFRCAVVYGRLPPEIRSEQAALFNDPDSGYDVMVGSDAIGMGLNLKIKRIVFESIRKWDGVNERMLSNSQMKQIAGRAGRYGMLDDVPAGFVTTLYENDLPLLRDALDAPIEPIKHARLGTSSESLRAISQALPLGSSTNTIYEVHLYASSLGKAYRFGEYAHLAEMANFIDTRGGELTLEDKKLLMVAPIPWRHEACMDVVEMFIRMYRNRMSVDLRQSLRHTDFMQTIIDVEEMMATGQTPISTPQTLQVLETFHRLLGLYQWLSYRNPVTYADFNQVEELKGRTEKVMEWSLQGVNANMQSRNRMESERMYMERRREQRGQDLDWRGRRQKQAENAVLGVDVKNYVRITR